MSRKHRFIAALSSGYLTLIATALFTAISIPLALHYLTREEFGLWTVVLQLTGYLTLLDLGIGQSVARLLVDSKDDVNGGVYGSVLKTAFLVFGFQGVTIVILAFTCNRIVGRMMNIPPSLASTFDSLLFWQCVVVAITFVLTPIFSLPLWSHQRSDIGNFGTAAALLVNLVFLWLGFVFGCKTFALLVSNVAGTVVSLGWNAWAVIQLKLLPSKHGWGKLRWEHSREVFLFSRDLVLINVGAQLISASQIVLVSRLIGLDAAAVWSICMKSFTMAQLLVCRVLDYSAAGLSEMIVRGEQARFRNRLASLVAITAVGAGLFAVLGALGNRNFVLLWTGGRVTWGAWNDVVAGIYLVCFCVNRCYTAVVGLVKNIGAYKYISLLEGVLVISGSILLAPSLKFLGVLVSSVFANLLCSGLYGAFRVARYFGASVSEVSASWLGGAIRFILLFAAVGAFIFWAGSRFQGVIAFGSSVALSSVVGLLLAILVGVPTDIRTEILAGLQRVRPG